jgi:hypothetical protein
MKRSCSKGFGERPTGYGPVILFENIIEVLHRSMPAILLQSAFGFELHNRLARGPIASPGSWAVQNPGERQPCYNHELRHYPGVLSSDTID